MTHSVKLLGLVMMPLQLKNLILFSMLRRELLRRDLVCLMQQLWLWLLITNLKVLVEVEAETIIREVIVMEEEVVVLVLVVAIILMVISTIALSPLRTTNLSLIHHNL